MADSLLHGNGGLRLPPAGWPSANETDTTGLAPARLRDVAASAASARRQLAPALMAQLESQAATRKAAPQQTQQSPFPPVRAGVDAWHAVTQTMHKPGLPLMLAMISVAGLSLLTFVWIHLRRAGHRRAGLSAHGHAAALMPDPPLAPSADEQAASEDLVRTAEAFFQHVAHIAERMKARDALRDVVSDELLNIEETLRSTALARACAAKDWGYVRACAVQILTDLERVRRVAQSANENSIDTFSPTVPADRAEALAVLGVNPDASEKAVKKVVDAMRQTWHPDLARNEVDRRTREARIKQINSAWDILRTRAQEA